MPPDQSLSEFYLELPKLRKRVRFPSPAPDSKELTWFQFLSNVRSSQGFSRGKRSVRWRFGKPPSPLQLIARAVLTNRSPSECFSLFRFGWAQQCGKWARRSQSCVGTDGHLMPSRFIL